MMSKYDYRHIFSSKYMEFSLFSISFFAFIIDKIKQNFCLGPLLRLYCRMAVENSSRINTIPHCNYEPTNDILIIIIIIYQYHQSFVTTILQ